MKLSTTLVLFLIYGCSSPLTDHGKEVKLVSLRGDKREIETIQNTLRKDGCKMRQRIQVAVPVDAKDPDQAVIYALKNKAAEGGGSGVMSTLKKQGNPPFIVGLVYVCPLGKGFQEDI